MHVPGCALDAGLGGKLRERLERCNELGAAVRVAARIEDVHADEQVARAEHLGPAEREAEHEGVACRHVGHRDAGGGLFGHGDGAIREGRAADTGQMHPHDAVLGGTLGARDTPRGLQFRVVTLSVVHRECVADEALLARERQRRGRIEAT